MKLSLGLSALVQVLGPLALSAVVACAAAAGEDGTTTTDDLESAAHPPPSDGGSPNTDAGSGGHTDAGVASDGGLLPPGSCIAENGKADLRCTPGAFNPAVTQATINTTICVVGWTNTIRPPSSYTTQMKNEQKPEYGEANVSNASLEEDHLVPLELGGNPHDPTNLWPEPRDSISPGQGAETKDQEESSLKEKVCSGQMTLDAARQKMLADWTH
jgi:hypothetical protein